MDPHRQPVVIAKTPFLAAERAGRHDQPMPGEIGRVLRDAMTPEIIGRGTDDRADRTDPDSGHARIAQVPDPQRQIHALLEQIGHPVEQQQPAGDVGMLVQEIEQYGGDVEPPEHHGRGDGQQAARRGVLALGRGFSILHLLQDALDIDEIAVSGLGQRDIARRPAEQARADMLLERRHRAGHRGRAHAQLPRRRSEPAAARDCGKDLHGVQPIHGPGLTSFHFAEQNLSFVGYSSGRLDSVIPGHPV